MGHFVEHAIDRARYLVWSPGHEAGGQAILFLHGKGECGTDPNILRPHSLGRAVQSHPERWPFHIVFPQKRDPELLWPDYRDLLASILNQVDSDYSIDHDRCHIMGLSQGGNGALRLANGLPWPFRTVTSFCGWADPEEVAGIIGERPLWLFHGDSDRVVPASGSQDIHQRMAAIGRPPRLTVYAGVGHNCWDLALAEPELPQWLSDPSAVLAENGPDLP